MIFSSIYLSLTSRNLCFFGLIKPLFNRFRLPNIYIMLQRQAIARNILTRTFSSLLTKDTQPFYRKNAFWTHWIIFTAVLKVATGMQFAVARLGSLFLQYLTTVYSMFSVQNVCSQMPEKVNSQRKSSSLTFV